MKEKCLQVLYAVLVGAMLPILVVQLCKPPIQPLELQQTKPSETATQPALNKKIQVLLPTEETVTMDLQDYLVGVILAEMPTSYALPALQSQAIVARTYALKRQGEGRHPGGAICTDSECCQAYVAENTYLDGLGFPQDIEIAAEAVKTTKDLVLTYGGALIEATYFHCSGGRTEEAVAVWGVDYPYLQSVDSPGEEEMEHYQDTVAFTKEELEKLLGRELSGTPKSWIGWTTYTTGGGVDRMYFAGKAYEGVQLRKLLKLYSTAFTMEATQSGIQVTTLGKGHRVGMSQSGAQAMALQGKQYEQILLHYYPGTRIDKMEDVG
ncbi:MAG: stage II sporulation protein D [Ruminococcaceae bacterium]|nr:stage II sporulation protein D [Oscillospiraceae bacterium]